MITEFQIFIESQVSNGSFGPFLFFILIFGGFLASLLPCVYPLYPITAGILKSRTHRVKWLHPVVYYFGLATMYLIFGLIAGISGGVFNAIMRYPETNLFLAYILFVLGLSSAELLHLPFFGSRSSNSNSNSLSGSFVLGMGAGLLSSPCVGPVVVSILLQVATSSEGNFGIFSLLAASLKMFAFGLGVGIPFLAIGVFGLTLPKSGKWMRYVQWSLALIILNFSLTYLLKAGESWGWTEVTSTKIYLLWILLVWSVFSYQDSSDYLSIRMKKALSVATSIGLTITIIIVILNSNANYQVDKQLQTLSTQKKQSEMSGNLEWFRDREIVFQKAEKSGKPIFIDFYADWCTNCKEFQKLSISDLALNRALLENAVLWKIEDTDPIFEEYANDERFPELKIGLPFFVILSPKGDLIFKTNDYLATKRMIEQLSIVK